MNLSGFQKPQKSLWNHHWVWEHAEMFPFYKSVIEDCEGWWLSGCRGLVAEYWRLKPRVSWVRLLATAGLFTFLYFHLITSKFLYFPACRKMLWAAGFSNQLDLNNFDTQVLWEIYYPWQSFDDNEQVSECLNLDIFLHPFYEQQSNNGMTIPAV